jgi:hypothetical protein
MLDTPTLLAIHQLDPDLQAVLKGTPLTTLDAFRSLRVNLQAVQELRSLQGEAVFHRCLRLGMPNDMRQDWPGPLSREREAC